VDHAVTVVILRAATNRTESDISVCGPFPLFQLCIQIVPDPKTRLKASRGPARPGTAVARIGFPQAQNNPPPAERYCDTPNASKFQLLDDGCGDKCDAERTAVLAASTCPGSRFGSEPHRRGAAEHASDGARAVDVRRGHAEIAGVVALPSRVLS